MENVPFFKRLVWAIDPFDEDARIWVGARRTIERLQSRTDVEVYPLHVFSTHELELAADLLASWTLQYLPKVELALREFIKEQNLKSVMPPEVVVQSSSSIGQNCDAASRYALRVAADAILVSTRGRSGIERLFGGSFAETLIHHAEVPVLITHRDEPFIGETEEPLKILFATDLSPEGEGGYLDQAIAICRQLGAKLVIAHSRPLLIEPFFPANGFVMGDAWVPLTQYTPEDGDARRSLVEGWASRAREEGVDAEALVDEDDVDVATGLVHAARARRVSMIVMASRTGPWASALIGSVTRQVVRRARCPVLVLKPTLAGESADTWGGLRGAA